MKLENMREVFCRLLITALVLFSGVFLRLVGWGTVGKFVNLFWEVVYGLGFLIVGLLPGGIDSRPAFIFGALVWPICVSLGVYLLSGFIWHRGSSKLHALFAILMILSLFCVISIDRAYQPPFNGFPLFGHFLFVIY